MTNLQYEQLKTTMYEQAVHNLLMTDEHEIENVLTVSSVTNQDGKDDVCWNLAKTLAVAGQKTLLIDTNFKSPAYGSQLGEDQKGLSDIIAQQLAADCCIHIQQTNFSLLTCGTCCENAVELYHSMKSINLKSCLEQYKKSFDFIIINAPALESGNESVVINRLGSGMMIVVDPCKTKKKQLKRLFEEMEKINEKIVGVFINNEIVY